MNDELYDRNVYGLTLRVWADASDYVEWLTKSRQLMRDCVTHGVIGIEGLRALLEVGSISYRQFKELETLAVQN